MPIELVFPSYHLDITDEAQRNRVFALVRLASRCFVAADVSLQMFEEAQDRFSKPVGLPSELSSEAEEEAIRESRPDVRTIMNDPSKLREATMRTARKFKRDRWKAGVVPRQYQIEHSLVCARAFLFACDGVYKALEKMLIEVGAPADMNKIKTDFDLEFPSLRAVRNSAHHYEDRVVGEAKHGKPLPTLSIGALPIVADCLFGTSYTATLVDGTLGELDVSGVSLGKLHVLVQRTIDAFPWHQSAIGPIYEP